MLADRGRDAPSGRAVEKMLPNLLCCEACHGERPAHECRQRGCCENAARSVRVECRFSRLGQAKKTGETVGENLTEARELQVFEGSARLARHLSRWLQFTSSNTVTAREYPLSASVLLFSSPVRA